ncbi:MAG: FIST N-terminal domain-containing protein [Pirellulales bacterium]
MNVTMTRCAHHLSTLADAHSAVAEGVVSLRQQLEGTLPSFVMLFASASHAGKLADAVQSVRDELGTRHVIGCTAESVAGGGREIEGEDALAMWAIHLPDVQVDSFRLAFARTPEGGVFEGWPDEALGDWPSDSCLLLLGDPFSFPADFLLERFNEDRPGVKVVGGMASGASTPGANRLILGSTTYSEGAVAVLLRGPSGLRTVVSQGCRPIGKPLVVTKAERNILIELGGRPALEQLKKVYDELPTREQQLFQRGLHVGRVVSEYQESFTAGDFLIRNVVGIDPRNGAVAVGDFFRPGQTVQFHLRDQETADDDLKQLLRDLSSDSSVKAAGALLFTCNGRGTRLFAQPHHDAQCIQQALGEIPLAGFFAAGELGPVGQENFMHGFTASIAVFTRKSD